MLNFIDVVSGTFTLSKWPSGTPDGHLLKVTIPDAASVQLNLLMMSIRWSKRVEDYNKLIVKQSKCASGWSLSKAGIVSRTVK